MSIADGGKSAVIVLARLPRAGSVKSRLAATLGAERAADVYRLTAENLFAECGRLPETVGQYLFYADVEDAPAIRAWAGGGFGYVAQRGDHFGQRMSEAFGQVFAEGAQKAVIVGSDVPDLSAELIAEALRLLDLYPAVIGPDHAGGYFLLGIKMVYTALFDQQLPWGTERVYERTLRIMADLDIVPAFLPPLFDLDVEGDLWRWLDSNPRPDHPLARHLRQSNRYATAHGGRRAAGID